jgi:hypothetical protein
MQSHVAYVEDFQTEVKELLTELDARRRAIGCADTKV